MKVYVATKFEDGHYAKKTMEALESAGQTITHDWTGESSVGKEGEELKNYLVLCAEKDMRGVQDCDALLLMNHPHGKGMFTELGIALALKKHIIIVAPNRANNIFFHLCQTVETIGEGISLIMELDKRLKQMGAA